MLYDYEEEINKAFYRHPKVAALSHALIIMGGFNHQDMCCKNNTVRHKQCRRFLPVH